MAEIEDVSGTSGGEGEHFADARLENIFRCEKGDGVEIALHGAAGTCSAPTLVEGNAPVESEDVGGGLAHRGEQRCRVDAEVDDGNAEGLDSLDQLGGGCEAVLAVVGDGESADPRVEDLDDVGAGFDLLLRVLDEDGDELFHEERPGGVTGVHHLLGLYIVARAAAFDHVAGEGERSSAEADDAETIAVGARRSKVGRDLFYRLGDVLKLFGAIGAERLNVLEGAHGSVDHGTFAGDKFEVEAHGGEGKKEVGEDDGGVDTEALGGGDGDLCGDLGLAAYVEQRVVLADGHVLRHIASGLAQKPDGRAVYGEAQAGSYKAAAALRM